MRKRIEMAAAVGITAILLLLAGVSPRLWATPGTWPYTTFTATVGSFTTSLAAAVFNVTGRETHGGIENHSGTVAFGGVVTSTANVQVQAATLSISSATTSRGSVNFIGAFESSGTFPLGVAEGSVAYALSNHVMYVATTTVVNSLCWKNMN